MPFYDYRCYTCNTVIEIFHSIKDNDNRYCPICGVVLTRVIGDTIFKLNGTGWAKDSYSKKSSAKQDGGSSD